MVLNSGTPKLFVCSYSLNTLPLSEVQKKAQAEIDSVIGNERLPGLSDRPHLPYVMALVTEVLRWNSVAPTGTLSAPFHSHLNSLVSLGVPHTAMEDGIISGYLIPKGSIIITNLWCVFTATLHLIITS